MKQTKHLSFKNSILTYYVSENAGIPILFLHGNSMSAKIWQRQFDNFLSEKFALIALDLPGHGESGHLAEYGLNVFSEAVLALIAHLQLKDYVVVGNSLGGDIILQCHAQLDKCKGIILVDTPPVSKPPAMDKALLPNPAIGMLFSREYDKSNLNALAEAMFYDLKNIPDFIIPDFEKTDGLIRQSLAEAVGAGNYMDEVESLRSINIPVSILSGANEKMVNNAYFESLDVPMLWKNKTHLVSDAAHCPQWENAEEFNALVDEFITEINS